ncbi:hypothetical Protein YC6258_00711 [Gynuella sunshinyii YC6258]|uniref:Uncharacterized protein n=1 Tax=Gynuella sunshinyii YC6258 TaxID=1445510 RepID=A0A0C5VF42_9GAMM|nr:hypothetical Protein YC6258_00711 [Gynuella sunshinyii YC6258]
MKIHDLDTPATDSNVCYYSFPAGSPLPQSLFCGPNYLL